MKEKLVFEADDGVVCDTAEEAAARDAVVARGAELNEWLASNYTPKKQVEYKRVLVAWLSK